METNVTLVKEPRGHWVARNIIGMVVGGFVVLAVDALYNMAVEARRNRKASK